MGPLISIRLFDPPPPRLFSISSFFSLPTFFHLCTDHHPNLIHFNSARSPFISYFSAPLHSRMVSSWKNKVSSSIPSLGLRVFSLLPLSLYLPPSLSLSPCFSLPAPLSLYLSPSLPPLSLPAPLSLSLSPSIPLSLSPCFSLPAPLSLSLSLPLPSLSPCFSLPAPLSLSLYLSPSLPPLSLVLSGYLSTLLLMLLRSH